MAVIAILSDIEEGHLLPSFGLAHALRKRGHEIRYISVPDNEALIKAQGFDFYEIFASYYPKGFNEKRKQLHKEGQPNITRQRLHLEEIASDNFGLFLEGLHADLFIVSVFLDIESLILYYKFGIEPVIYTPLLREPGMTILSNCIDEIFKMPENKITEMVGILDQLGVKAGSFKDLIQPLSKFCELILCPQEMEIEDRPKVNNCYYIGPGILGRKGEDEPLLLPDGAEQKKIIYACLGSQTAAYGAISNLFFSTMLQVMRSEEMKDKQLVLAIGHAHNEADLIPLSSNVRVVKWVSQIDLLKQSSLAIVHGGLGTVKECIYYGVPMIVIPITRDQPSNAKRIEYHQLGLTVTPDEVTYQSLHAAILQIFNSEHIQTGIRRMQNIFMHKDEAKEGIVIIEDLLQQKKKQPEQISRVSG